MSTTKIYLAPSDQTENTYTGAATNEGEQCHEIAYELEKLLQQIPGIEVRCNHSMSISLGVTASNAWEADYHICLHTNAYDGSVAGTRILYGIAGGDGQKMGEAIMETLAPITPGSSDSITQRSDLMEVKTVYAYTVYVEIGFHDNLQEAAWIVSHHQEIAAAICAGICKHLGLKAPVSARPARYHVYILETDDLQQAEAVADSLHALGVDGATVEEVTV